MTRAILIIAVIVILAILPFWPYSAAWGYVPGVQVALAFLILVILRVFRIV
jgi:hypothetical protein